MKDGNEAVALFDFEDNQLLSLLFGDQDQYLMHIEKAFDVIIYARGNHVTLKGDASKTDSALKTLKKLYDRLKKGQQISIADIDTVIRMYICPSYDEEKTYNPDLEVIIPARGRVISPRTPGQSHYLKLIQQHDLTFGVGPAGTGKTYLAMAGAVAALLSGQISRIILSRPAVEAGERLGFLPGDLREKVDPYLRPLFDALYEMLPSEQITKRIANGEIEIAPLAFMRGRTLGRAFIILDEAQNTTIPQMKMFLTRLGEGSKMVVTGDVTQIDLPTNMQSGLTHVLEVLRSIPGIGFASFNETDIVRHPLVARIVKAYDNHPSL